VLEQYFIALFGGRTPGLARSALPDAPVQPQRDGAAPAGPPLAAGPKRSSEWDPCPCGKWGVARSDRHGCVALCKELFPQLDQELDAWEAEHRWLYR
jgi:hypothetical protein